MEQEDIGDLPIDDSICLQDDNSQINISDVIEVIQTTDPVLGPAMFTNNGENTSTAAQQQQQQQQQQQPHHSSQQPQSIHGTTKIAKESTANLIRRNAYVRITEQPAPKALRFRYECEGRSAGSIPGVNNTPENKTFPSIQVVGHRGRAVVVVSCVTKDQPYRPHPHNLVGKDGCKKGVCTVAINEETMSVTFSNLGIQCVKKKDIEEALRLRDEIKVDPFKTGFAHRSQPSSIDLNSVRLCFQVFIEHPEGYIALSPVVSDPIYDKKAMSDLVICKLSDCSCNVAGGKEIILLCEKVAKEDIQVRFYEERDGQLVWEGYGDFQHTNVHKQVAISFRTPRYRTLEVDQIVKVFIQLKRPSDGATSEPLPFDFLPLDSVLKHKRPKIENRELLFKRIQDHDQQRHQQQPQQHQQQQKDGRSSQAVGGFLNVPPDPIKKEPRDLSPANYNMFGGTYRVPQASPSPQPLSPGTPVTPIYQPQILNNTSPYNLLQQHQPQQQQQQNYETGNPNLHLNMNFDGNFAPNFHSPNGAGNGGTTPVPTHHYSSTQPTSQWNILPNIAPLQQQQSSIKFLQTLNNLNTNSFQMDNLITIGQNAITAVSLSTTTSTTTATANLQNGPITIAENSIPSNLSNLFMDMDTQQLAQLNSAELSGLSLSLLDGHYSMSGLVDPVKQEQQSKIEVEQENMTDSFTRLTTATINELTDLGNMYNRTHNNQ